MQAYRPQQKQQQLMDLTKINDCQKSPPQCLPLPQSEPKTFQHFEQYKKIYLTSYLLSTERQRLSETITNLMQSLEQIEETQEDIQKCNNGSSSKEKQSSDKINKEESEEDNRIKRARRKADDIQRKYECREEYCGRKYGAHASLMQHVKIKHPLAYEQYC